MPLDLENVRQEIEKELQSLPLEGEPKELYEPIRYILNIGGKRLRPTLAVLGYQIFNDNYGNVLKPALALEVFHNFTLMHDDIMDQAPLRRGKETVHEKWSPNVAILSGDVMLVKAYELLLGIDQNILAKVIAAFNKCACEVCEGQQFDMNFETEKDTSIPAYLEMIRLKTAVLLGFSLEMGAILGGAPNEEAELLKNFGERIGLGFQIKDDLLDVFGEQEKFGKQVGGDIIANKKTYLLLKALEDANTTQKQTLEHWLSKTEFDPKEKVAAVRNIYDELDIEQKAQNLAQNYFDEAFSLFNDLKREGHKKAPLKTFAEKLINRVR